MKELLIRVSIDNESEKIVTAIKHRGFTDDGRYSISQILETIGILDNLKQQMEAKLKRGTVVDGIQ